MINIWKKLAKKKKPFFILAPMAGVTDSPFRQMVCKIGKPDIMFTEFVSTEHIARVDKTPLVLKYSKKESPVMAQFFGCKLEQFEKCAKLALELGFDGIDINMGCPDRKVQKQGSGSELIKNPELAIKIIREIKKIVGDKIPVSIKTRIGYSKKDDSHILAIAKEGVAAVTIHGRTAKQGYSGEADWEEIGRLSGLIKKINPETVVIGNGDVKNLEQGRELAKKYGVDGVMIGRQILHDPWVFGGKSPTVKKRLKMCLDHTLLYKKFYKVKDEKGYKADVGVMKKYYKAYLAGVPKDLVCKKELMEARTFTEAEKTLKCQINFK